MFIERTIRDTDFKTINGTCPIDGTPLVYHSFSASNLDLRLSPPWYPYVFKVCPLCLCGSAEHDFHSTTVRQSGTGSLSEAVRSPYSGVNREFTRFLPLRLRLAKDCVNAMTAEERNALLSVRQLSIEAYTRKFISTCLAFAPQEATDKLVNHVLGLLSAGHDPEPIVQKVAQNANFLLAQQDLPIVRLANMGCSHSDLASTSVYGPMFATIEAETINRLQDYDTALEGAQTKVTLLQLALDRLSIYTHMLVQKDPLRAIIRQPGVENDFDSIEEKVDVYIRGELSQRSQGGYMILSLGRSFSRAAFFMLDRQAAGYSFSHDETQALKVYVEKAIRYLELSLVAEKYPEFEKDEKIMQLHKRYRVTVPYFFGEFGVRHLLCCLYNAQGSILQAEGVERKQLSDIAKHIVTQWSHNHNHFRLYDFGTINDPKAVKELIPRMIVFADTCFHPVACDQIKKKIDAHSDKMYARYVDDARALSAD